MAHIRQSRFHAHPTMDLLVKALLDGDHAEAVAVARALLAAGIQKESIVKEGVEESMSQLDVKCTVEYFNLLEIMLAGRAATAVMKELYPAGTFLPQTKGPIVLGSLEGDIHDLGKNVLKMVLSAKGYRVVDCGKDCPVESILDAAAQEGALAIGVSGLITSVIPLVRTLKKKMKERGLEHRKILAGGAALKQASAADLNVDFVAETAFDGVAYLDRLAGSRNEQH